MTMSQEERYWYWKEYNIGYKIGISSDVLAQQAHELSLQRLSDSKVMTARIMGYAKGLAAGEEAKDKNHLSDDHPLLRKAIEAVEAPSIWERIVGEVGQESFMRELGPRFLEITRSLSDAQPIAPPPYGFLAGALAFEMARNFSISDRARNIANTGLRILEEPLSDNPLSLSVRIQVATRVLTEGSFQGHLIRKAEAYIHRGRAHLDLGEMKQAKSDYAKGASTIIALPERSLTRDDMSIAFHKSMATADFLDKVARTRDCSWASDMAQTYRQCGDKFRRT